jgi:hypothetical protein
VIVAAPLDPDAKMGPVISQATKPVLTIIVVGETARAQDFSLGGYERKTNPELEKRDIAYFSNTTSCGTATAASVPACFRIWDAAAIRMTRGWRRKTFLMSHPCRRECHLVGKQHRRQSGRNPHCQPKFLTGKRSRLLCCLRMP